MCEGGGCGNVDNLVVALFCLLFPLPGYALPDPGTPWRASHGSAQVVIYASVRTMTSQLIFVFGRGT